MFGKPQISPELLLGLGGGILSGQNFAQGMGQGFQNASNIMTLQRQEQQIKEGENRTRAFVQKMFPNEDVTNMPPEILKQYANQAIQQRFAKPEKPDFKTVGGALYNTQTGEWISPPADMVQNSVKRGLTPVWGMKDGKRVLGTLGEDGSFLETKLPEGFEPTPGTSTVDLGTSIGIRDNKSGEIIRQVPKDIAGAKEQEVIGKTTGDRKTQINDVVARADKAIKTIDEAINSPGLESATGWQSSFPTWPGSNSANFEAKIKEIQGASFLEAYQSLKGAGQISEVEGAKAENAIANLSLAQSDAQMRKALADLKEVITSGRERAKRAAGVETPATPTATQDGYNTTTSGVKWKVPGQ